MPAAHGYHDLDLTWRLLFECTPDCELHGGASARISPPFDARPVRPAQAVTDPTGTRVEEIVDSVPGARERYEKLLAARAAAEGGGPRFDVLLPASVLTHMWYGMRQHLRDVLEILGDATTEAIAREIQAGALRPAEATTEPAAAPDPEAWAFE